MKTLDILTWNIENFQKIIIIVDTQEQYNKRFIIDVIALQEIESQCIFTK